MNKKTIIIPAAGLASRMKPLSRGISKAMIPVNGRPLISYIIEHLIANGGFSEMIIIENELGDIKEFVKRVYPHENITFVHQKQKNGPLHAIHLGWLESLVQDSPVTIWLGDTICLDKFNWHEDFVAVHDVPDPHRWCLIDKHGKLYDKPDYDVPTNSALVGVYNFTDREAFDQAITEGMRHEPYKGEYQIAGLLEEYQKLTNPFELVKVTEWYDCGELSTYYESKAKLLKRTARSFNRIDVDTFLCTVTKSSTDEKKQDKIELEKNWFKGLTEAQSLFCPRILKSEYGTMIMTLEPGIALNEVLVYDNLRVDVWKEIIRKILRVHHDIFLSQSDKVSSETQKIACFESYYLKNSGRMKEITKQFGHPEVEEFVNNTGLELCKDPIWSRVIHGDSHLGNIIYDPHSGNIKFVDPRGSFGHIVGTEGDLRYDLGKLLQDFYCGYAMMMADRFSFLPDGETVKIDWVGDTDKIVNFLEKELANYGYDLVLLKKLAIVLLVTAIPFHEDNPKRQKAFFYRALNLMKDFNEPIH